MVSESGAVKELITVRRPCIYLLELLAPLYVARVFYVVACASAFVSYNE